MPEATVNCARPEAEGVTAENAPVSSAVKAITPFTAPCMADTDVGT